jgi:hypothetical protein
MARSRPGIKQLVLCDAGSLLTTPAGHIAIGLRNAAPMKVSPFKSVKDYLNRDWRNKENYNIQAETLQGNLYLLSKLNGWLNGNVDIQVLTQKQTASANSEDVYQFAAVAIDTVSTDMKLGLDYEYMLTGDKQSVKITAEGAFAYDISKKFKDLADSASAISFSGISGRGDNQTLYRAPIYLAFEAPASTAILTGGREMIAERSISIKTKNKKGEEDNRSIVDYLSVEIMFKFREADVAKQVAIMAKDNSPSVVFKERTGGTLASPLYNSFSFAAGVLSLSHDYDDTDDDRTLTLNFTGDVNLMDVSFVFGDGAGGTVEDTTGALGTGGTMSFANG